MKLFPLYNEQFKLKQAISSVLKQPGISSKSSHDIYGLLLRSFEVSDLDTFDDVPSLRKVSKVERSKNGQSRTMTIEYEKRGPLFGPLDVVLKIHEEMVLPGSGDES
ncbi:MAG: DUF4845 domain-containing protein [Gammaproteobacteria bacterium]